MVELFAFFAFVREQCSQAEIHIIANPGGWAHCRAGSDLQALGSEAGGKLHQPRRSVSCMPIPTDRSQTQGSLYVVTLWQGWLNNG